MINDPTQYITFNTHAIQEYIRRTSEKSTDDMTNEERRQFIQQKVSECEKKLKQYLLNFFTYSVGEEEGKRIMLTHYGV